MEASFKTIGVFSMGGEILEVVRYDNPLKFKTREELKRFGEDFTSNMEEKHCQMVMIEVGYLASKNQ